MSTQQATSNTFTDDGRLLQAEYAIKNVSEAGTIAGVVCRDGVVMLGINSEPSQSVEKIYEIGGGVYCSVAGVFSDALRLVKYARLSVAEMKNKLKRDPGVKNVCYCVASEKQKYTQGAGSRPFGVSLLYCGKNEGEYSLYSTDPSGTINRWRACAYGKDEDSINSGMRNSVPDVGMSVKEGMRWMLEVISKARENPSDIAERIEILEYSENGASMVNKEEISKMISEIGRSK